MALNQKRIHKTKVKCTPEVIIGDKLCVSSVAGLKTGSCRVSISVLGLAIT